MSLDGLAPGARPDQPPVVPAPPAEPAQPTSLAPEAATVIPVNVVKPASEQLLNQLDQTEAISPFPFHAAGAETSLAETVEGAREGVAVAEGSGDEAKVKTVPADAEETIVDAGEDGPVAVKVTDPNAEAHAAVEGVGKMGGETRLEELIGKPSADPKAPAEAPEISADGFVSKGLDVPPVRTTPQAGAEITSAAPGAADFTSPYPLPEKLAETTAPGPVALQTLSGLPGTLPPPAAVESQIPTVPAESVAPIAPEQPVAELQAPVNPAVPLAPELSNAPIEEPAPQPEQTVEAEDPTKVVDEFLAIDPVVMIKESGGMADRSSFLLAAQYREVQINIKNMRENGWSDAILVPVVKDYKNALESKSGETS